MIVFLRRAGSAFADSLARLARDELTVLDLEAIEAGAPVSIAGERVLWQGVELTGARAVLVEELPFAWPQRLSGPGAAADDDRPRRALACSALCATAERVPMVDPPAAGHLAALPLLALALCAESGIAVQPYRLEPARPAAQDTSAGDERIWLDAAGAVGGYTSAAPAAGEPAWSHAPFAGEVLRVLVVGERAVGALICASGAAWARGRHDGALPRAQLDLGACSVAEAAARALACHAAEVTLARADGALLQARPGPSWSAFEAALGPSVPRALWEHALVLES